MPQDYFPIMNKLRERVEERSYRGFKNKKHGRGGLREEDTVVCHHKQNNTIHDSDSKQ